MGQLEGAQGGALFEERVSFSEHDWMHHEPVDVDQVVRHKAVDQLAAAVDEDVLPGLLLQLPDLFCDIALEQCPVPVERLRGFA